MARISLPFSIILGACVAASAAAQSRPAAPPSKTVWPGEGPLKWAPRPTTPEISANDLRTRLYQFADDSMSGRRIGEPGNYKGTEYIAREFKRMGLKPGGDDGTYFQVLPFGPTGFDAASSRLLVAGSPLAARLDWIPVAPSTTNGLAGKAALTDVPTVFAGRWGDTTVALDPAVFRGKVAVFIEASAPAARDAVAGEGVQVRPFRAATPCPTSSARPPRRSSRRRLAPTVPLDAEGVGVARAEAGEGVGAAER